ncbi:MAG: hypothetical protein JNL42_04180 [Anaerolineae bacterium]|nr:hypothetical protein [Anaerolineae bacterium]
MALPDLMREVKALSRDEFEALYLFVQHQREYWRSQEQEPKSLDRRNAALDIDELKQIFAELREGFTEADLDELDWAMNAEIVKPTDEDT